MNTSRDPNSVIYVGFWKRVLAYIIDDLVYIIPYVIIEIIFDEKIYPVLNFIIQWLFYWAYTAGLHSSSWQATVGKKVLGIIVVDKYGDRLTLKRATVRFFASNIFGWLQAIFSFMDLANSTKIFIRTPLLLLLFFSYAMVGWTKRKQGLHDKIAKTFVIKK